MQISTWILFPLLLLQFYTCLSPVIPSLVASIVVSILYSGVGLVGVYLGYRASVINPIDERLKRELESHQQHQQPANKIRQTHRDEEQEIEADTKFCWVCQTRVHVKSMHCKFCDKCVQHFDHHCQWLNTCIGEVNYRYFFGTLCGLAVFFCIHVAVSLYVTITFFVQRQQQQTQVQAQPQQDDGTDTATTYQRLSDLYGGGGELVIISIILLFLVMTLFFTGLIFQLCYFHIMLQRKGITTYEYIVRDNALKREHVKEEREITSMRIQAIADRQRNGQCTWWISMASYCPGCDPIRREKKRSTGSDYLVEGHKLANGNGDHHGHDHAVDDDNNVDNNEDRKAPSPHYGSKSPHKKQVTTDTNDEDGEDEQHFHGSNTKLPCLDGQESGVIHDQSQEVQFIPVSRVT